MNGKRGLKNIIWGFLAQLITIGLGIIIPRLVLVNLGSESNGLLNSVSSILSYMSLLEAGVGTATVQALFKPIAKDDKKEICKIMVATHYFYRRTGYIYLFLVILLSVGYTLLVNSELPRIFVFLVVLMAGLSGVISYFFQGKFKLLLSAEGKGYITTNITTVTTVGVSITKAICLMAGANVVIIQGIYFVFNLIQMAIFSIYMSKNYKWLDLEATPNFQAISQKNAVLVHQISSLIFNNTDIIILTAFTSLKSVSVYSMYAMIFGMVKSISITLSDSYVYSLGQSYNINRSSFMKKFNVYEVYNMSITTALFCIAGILILPFLNLYTSGVNDINYIDKYIAKLFVTFYLLSNARKPSNVVIDIAQHFKQTQWRSALEAAINLITSLILTYRFGIYGVLLGTIVALLYRTNDIIIYASKLLERSPMISYRRWIVNIIMCSLFMWASTFVGFSLDSYPKLVVYGLVLCIIIIPTFLGIDSLLDIDSAKYMYSFICDLFNSKFARKDS